MPWPLHRRHSCASRVTCTGWPAREAVSSSLQTKVLNSSQVLQHIPSEVIQRVTGLCGWSSMGIAVSSLPSCKYHSKEVAGLFKEVDGYLS